MSAVTAVLLVSFLALLAVDAPIAVAIALSTFLAVLASGGDPGFVLALTMANGIDSFTLLAIPLFVLSGMLMGRGGVARRLIDLASALMGRFPGGLAYVNTLACMLFGSISGSAAAGVSSVGGFMIPEMVRKGYPREFATALTITSATTGLIIPPSNIMIVYAVSAGSVSIIGLFLAGVIPGILIGLCLMGACFLWTRRHSVKADAPAPWSEVRRAMAGAVPSLLLIVIAIAGILSGWFTATEAAVISVAYAFLLAVVLYREVRLDELPGILADSAVTTGVVLLLVGASSAMSWMLTTENVPQAVTAALGLLGDDPLVTLLVINLLLLAVGTFMDITPAVLILTPILLPVVVAQGMDPLHFGIIMITNLCIGLCTPPVGSCLFIGCGVGKTTLAKVTPSLIPFFIAMLLGLALISIFPGLSTWLPGLFA
ncbi:MAG: TRAP transporter large permease [Opitutia bacterium]|jgi:tripartite ATP-independent transporter DctM subunit